MAFNLYDIPLDFSPVNAIFVSGEKGVALSPSEYVYVGGEQVYVDSQEVWIRTTTLATGTYYVSRWIEVGEGIYDLKLFFPVNGTIQFGSEPPISIKARTAFVGRVALPDGPFRINIVLNHVAIYETLFFAFQLYRQDRSYYLSSADGWRYNIHPMSDAELEAASDPRLALPVLPVSPNWAKGIVERISYLTEVLSSEKGVEQRRSLRKWPRRQFELEYVRDAENRTRLDTFFTNIARREFLFPLWHEQFRPTAGIPAGTVYCSFPSGTLALREFQPNDVVLISNGDPNQYELSVVLSTDHASDTITFKSPVVGDWAPGSKLVPLRKALVINKATQAAPTDNVGIFRAQIDLVDPDDRFTPSWGYCVPLWRFKVQRSDQLDIGYSTVDYQVDNETGPLAFYDTSKDSTVDTRFSSIAFGRETLVALRQFFAAARGRAKRFWFPSFTSDLILASDIEGSDHIDVNPNGVADYVYSVRSARKFIGIFFDDGSPTIYREVRSVGVIGEGRPTAERIYLTKDVPPITKSLVTRIQFVVPSRFDQDRFELQHLVDSGGAVRVNLVTRSTEDAGMPPIECSLTSRVYPVESIEEMHGSLFITGGKLHTGELQTEELLGSLSMDSAVLRSGVQTYNAPQEDSLSSAFSVTAGTLQLRGFLSLNQDTDSLSSTVEITNGSLRVALVTKQVDRDELSGALNITTGSLT